MSPTPRMIDDVVFFTTYFREIGRQLTRFTQAFRILRVDIQDSSERTCLIESGNALMAIAFHICGVEPPSSGNNSASIKIFSDALVLDTILSQMSEGVAKDCRDALSIHINYLLGLHPSIITDSDSAVDFSVIRDSVLNIVGVLSGSIFNHYKWRSSDPRGSSEFFDADAAVRQFSARSVEMIAASKERLDGWCTQAKAAMLYTLIREHKPLNAVEIGVYGGRSIVPIAAALQDNMAGTVTGIETWSSSVIGKSHTSVKNDFAWSIADYGLIKKAFLSFCVEYNLHTVIKIIEASSEYAHALFDAIDFLHIDGGHSSFGATQDVVNFVAKVPPGGIIVFDDIEWESTRPGVEVLMDTCRLLHVVGSADRSDVASCAAFVRL